MSNDLGMRVGINGSSLISLNRPTSEITAHATAAERTRALLQNVAASV